MSVKVGPVVRLSDNAGTDLTFLKKFSTSVCCESACEGAPFRPDDMFVWYCRNAAASCGAKSHIRCIRSRMRKQADTNVKIFGCRLCGVILSTDDTDKIKDISFDEQEHRIDLLDKKVEDLSRMVQTVINSNQEMQLQIQGLEIDNKKCRSENAVAKNMIEELVKRLGG